MSRLRLLLWLAFTLLAGCQDSRRLAALPAGSSVLAFGNSITFGTGAGPGPRITRADWPPVAAGRSHNAGLPGDTAAAARERIAGRTRRHTSGIGHRRNRRQ
jgi:acyl-CoA thioesterase-1